MSTVEKDLTCDECGGPAEFELVDKAFCSSCYYARGSCCNERPEHFGESCDQSAFKKLGE